ncbi:hypothetical protein [Corynebacterium glyciniphilum]|uniref:hypothetical protein n=1 Tax=Corynebacterium glyciniphilum TaxID=1404244 RepID=UPI0011AB417F|nr:hypothetical protein [Corynebacterium glyciniphilum]
MNTDDLPDDFATERDVLNYARDHSLNFSRGQNEIAITVGDEVVRYAWNGRPPERFTRKR